MGRAKTKPFLKRKKVSKLYFHFWPPKKCPPFFFLIHTWSCENITASPCGICVFIGVPIIRGEGKITGLTPTYFPTSSVVVLRRRVDVSFDMLMVLLTHHYSISLFITVKNSIEILI